MSTYENDVLYDRASELIPYLNTGEAMDLNGSLEDLESLYQLVKRLEDKYLGKVQADALVTLKTAENNPHGINQAAVMEAIRNIEANKRGEQ